MYNVYGDRKIPRQLTPATASVPPTFLGREQELDDIRTLLTQRNTIALVNSEGGMGKTTLAARYWEKYQHEYKHLAWLFCEKGILAAMRDHLPQPLDLVEAMNQCADDPDKQAEIIKTALANLEKDCLLVFDNANEPEHIHGFLQYMNGLGWHVLITSRCSKVLPDAASEYPISHLPPDLAKELFRKNYEERSPQFDALLDRFLNAVGYNTLCTEVFSKNLREGAAWGLTFEKLLTQLEKNGLFLGDDSFEIQTDYALNVKKETVKSTDQIIEALYNVADLQQRDPALHDLLVKFALLPAENHAPAVLLELFAPENKNELKHQLDRLVQKGWLSTDTKTYRISPVVQKIVLQKNAARLWALGEPMVKKLNVLFENEGYHSKNIATAAPFAALVFELVEHLYTANEDLARLYDRLWVYYTATGNLAKALDTADRMQILCKRFGDKHRLAISYSNLGSTHTALGNLRKAFTFLELYNQLAKDLYQTYPQDQEVKNNLAVSYERLGSMHNVLGDLKNALTFIKQYNQLEKELNKDYPHNVEFKKGLAISYEKLGETHTTLSNLELALSCFEKFTKLVRELHDAYPQNVSFKNGLAISYSKLGNTHTALGNLPQALTFFEQYNQLEKELHKAYPQNVEYKNGLAISYSKLGTFYRDKKGDKAKAREYFQQCFTLWEELSGAYPAYVEFRKNFDWAKEVLEGL